MNEKHGPVPRYVRQVATNPDSELEARLIREYGIETTVVGIACHCGHDRFRAVGRDFGSRRNLVGGPIRLQCAKCKEDLVLFDPGRHGFEGALGQHSQSAMPDTPEMVVACPKCTQDVFVVAAGFQYAGEDEGLEFGGAMDLQPEDVFGWFAARCRCAACGSDFEMASIECA